MPSIQFALDVIKLAVDPSHPTEARCPACQELLTVHQPDVELPDRLLGVCPECRVWLLIDATVGVMIRLPHPGALRDALPTSPPGASRSVHPGP
jgi:hypothetical protein